MFVIARTIILSNSAVADAHVYSAVQSLTFNVQPENSRSDLYLDARNKAEPDCRLIQLAGERAVHTIS